MSTIPNNQPFVSSNQPCQEHDFESLKSLSVSKSGRISLSKSKISDIVRLIDWLVSKILSKNHDSSRGNVIKEVNKFIAISLNKLGSSDASYSLDHREIAKIRTIIHRLDSWGITPEEKNELSALENRLNHLPSVEVGAAYVKVCKDLEEVREDLQTASKNIKPIDEDYIFRYDDPISKKIEEICQQHVKPIIEVIIEDRNTDYLEILKKYIFKLKEVDRLNNETPDHKGDWLKSLEEEYPWIKDFPELDLRKIPPPLKIR